MPNHGKARVVPTALKRLRGTLNVTRERQRGGAEPVPIGALTEKAPVELSPAERTVWRATIRAMPKGVLFRVDREVVKAWCRVVVRVDELQRALSGQIGEPGWETSAGHRSLDRALLLLARLAAELGFSPASRPRIHVAPEPPADDANNPWAALRLIGGNGPTSASAPSR
jgi:phage terminase small subunit